MDDTQRQDNAMAKDAADKSQEHNVIVAAVENRAREVGLACLDLINLRLHLHQFIEAGNSYTNTLLLLTTYAPSELLIVTSNQQVFASGLNRATRQYQQVSMARSLFDDTKGLQLLDTFARSDAEAGNESAKENGWRQSHYLAHGAAGAVLQHFSTAGRRVLAAHSLQVVYGGTSKHMVMDTATIEALELVQPVSGKHFRRRDRGACLYSMLNRTNTSVGARLLRTSLLQPLCDVATVEARLSCVQELVENDNILFDVMSCLTKFSKNLHKLCADIAICEHVVKTQTPQRIACRVQSIMQLRQTLQTIPALADATANATSDILKTVHSNCSRPEFCEMLTKISEVLDDEAEPNTTPFINKIQQCFAIKSDADQFLDMARSSVCRITDEIHELGNKYRDDHDMPHLKVSYNALTGFTLQLPANTRGTSQSDQHSVPRSFISLGKRGPSSVSYSTHELNALNTRLRDSTNECMILTLQTLERLTSELMQHLGLLTKLVDTIALTDLLCSFADVATSLRGYVRPRIQLEGPLAIIQGRHPILEQDEEVEYQANDTYLCESSSLHIISGPNMAGKSTYLKQVALITIMAQAGCFVPATFASIPLFAQLFGRIGSGDSIETNCSSFMVEMKEMAHILACASCNSLVIVDELGRATSTSDGTGIAWAMCEHLISSGAKTLVATHFPLLRHLAQLYPTCKAWELAVEVGHCSMNYKRNLQPCAQAGQTQHYGLVLAAMLGMPQPILEHARLVVDQLDAQQQACAHIPQDGDSAVLPQLYSLVHKLGCLARQTGPGSEQTLTTKTMDALRLLQNDAKQLCDVLPPT